MVVKGMVKYANLASCAFLSVICFTRKISQSHKGGTLETPLGCPGHPLTEAAEVLFNPILGLGNWELSFSLLLPRSVDHPVADLGQTWRLGKQHFPPLNDLSCRSESSNKSL